MIIGVDAADLGQLLYEQASNRPCVRLGFCVDPSRMTATERFASLSSIPMLTGHGEGNELGELIHSFHQWGRPINVGLIQAEGIFQFWIEPDDPA